jgi:hypothetical protein
LLYIKDASSRAAISPALGRGLSPSSSCLDDMSGLSGKHNSSELNKSESSMCGGYNMKKSKRDPIVEYDTELAESIEYELGLKKQNGPRY